MLSKILKLQQRQLLNPWIVHCNITNILNYSGKPPRCENRNISFNTSIQNVLWNKRYNYNHILHRCNSFEKTDKEVTLSRSQKLKRAVAAYGSTVIIFHVGISLVSLGTCYVLVSSGLDMGNILMPIGITGSIAENTGTFVMAYAIHKVFAPVRISITLASTPFIVKYLRNIGFLKKA